MVCGAMMRFVGGPWGGQDHPVTVPLLRVWIVHELDGPGHLDIEAPIMESIMVTSHAYQLARFRWHDGRVGSVYLHESHDPLEWEEEDAQEWDDLPEEVQRHLEGWEPCLV